MIWHERSFREIAWRAAQRLRKANRRRLLLGLIDAHTMRRRARRMNDFADIRWLAAATADEIAMGLIKQEKK